MLKNVRKLQNFTYFINLQASDHQSLPLTTSSYG